MLALVLFLFPLFSSLAAAGTIDFENLADSTPIASTYSAQGAVFTSATVLTAGVSLNEFEFPPRSGANIAAADAGSIAIAFSTPLSVFSGYFTHSAVLTVTAYGSSGTVLATTRSAFNNNLKLSGDAGSTPNELLQVSAPNITRVTITGAGDFTLDDMTFTPQGQVQCPTLSRSYVGTGSPFGQVSVNVLGSCSWSATSNAPWIMVVSGSSGTGKGVVQFSIGANSGLMRTGTVTIGGQILTVLQAGTDTKPPFGIIDTPINGSTNQAGAIGFTGWALSSITIAQVALCREPVPGESTNVIDPHCLVSSSPTGLVYLGNAVLVPGVRPDVASTFPGYPNNNWGWGAQILTNFLPGTNGLPLGNGTFRLHAIAADPAGVSTDLGITTISANNAASILPFGTIDTPGQGETISGADYVNFGWVVTPQPKIIPIDASTITVYIDNQPVGHPTYNNVRSDIATLFPGLRNTSNGNGGVGFFHIDTTKLSNGIHTIQWGATDSASNAAGLGSRYFFVQN